ncbi:MAG: M3 family metallopeptidase [candidate division KSB1 bacterium]|nr:M3 family metallopeptidase [candidate division KSB1 bacterium]
MLDSFSDFSPEFAGLLEQAFSKRWIDAEVRPGKRGGAFCHGVTPSTHPYVLVNYVDNLDSVYTLAHELGHALHDVLAGEQQTLLTYHPPLVLAETASVFAEMLLTRKLLNMELDRETRMQILASKLEDFLGTISRQTMYTLFERDAHLEGGQRRLAADELCNMWIKRRNEMYGDVVDFLPEERWFWSVIPHFIHTRFYCYAYTFGALLVLALYHQYEQEGTAFLPKYRRLLSAGDSDWPEKLVADVGLDFRSESFWQAGFRVVDSLLNEFEDAVRWA